MQDKILEINLERSRVYWDYYKMMFLVFAHCFIAGMISTAIIYSAGGVDIVFALGVIFLLFLLVILLAALMSLSIWRHENKHLDDLMDIEADDVGMEGDEPPMEPQGMPII